jgi:hypothetical protein
MIQGHVFDALLSPHVKSASWYYIHDFFHGFIAPVFLFASGVAYGVSTIRNWEEHIVWGERVRRRIGKFLALIAIGYALHLPYFSLRKIISTATSPEINSWLEVDALQCIGFTLLMLQIGVLFLRKEKWFIAATGIASAVIIFGSPLIWSTHFGGKMPVWLSAYMNGDNGSWFPLFPWSAYILSGVVLGYFFVNAGEHGHSAMMWKNVGLSAGIALLAILAMRLGFNFYPQHDFWKSDPSIVFLRLGVVSVFSAGVFFVEHSLRMPLRVPLIMGKESLFVYVVHLLIVYGSVLGAGLNQVVGATLSAGQALGVFVLVLAVTMVLTVLWYDLNSKHQTVAFRLKIAGAAIFLLAFVIRPW